MHASNNSHGTFERYIGIDYSGAETAESSLKGLSIYLAGPASAPVEVKPVTGHKNIGAGAALPSGWPGFCAKTGQRSSGSITAFPFQCSIFTNIVCP